MPNKKKNNKKYYKKKSYKRKSVVQKGPLALRMPVKMRYNDSFSLDPIASLASNHVFSCNGLFDPNITATGHQPRGFDEIIAMYDHYVCIASKITVTVANPHERACIVGIVVKDGVTTTADPEDLMENRYMKYITIPGRNGEVGESVRTISMKVNPNKFLGRSKPMADPELKGSSTSNPAEGCFFHVFCYLIDPSVEQGALTAQVVLDYTSVFIEPKQPFKS